MIRSTVRLYFQIELYCAAVRFAGVKGEHDERTSGMRGMKNTQSKAKHCVLNSNKLKRNMLI